MSSEIPRRGRSRRGRCANLSQIARQICAKLHKISFRASQEVCAKLSQICREFESQFRTILCKYPFSNAPFLEFYLSFLESPGTSLELVLHNATERSAQTTGLLLNICARGWRTATGVYMTSCSRRPHLAQQTTGELERNIEREREVAATLSFLSLTSLKTLTSLNKEVKPFFLGDNSIWSFPSFSSLSDNKQHLEVLKAILALRS